MNLLFLVVIGLLLFFTCKSYTKENMSRLTYLKQYENQDWYRNNPSIWPIVDIPQTVENKILRR